MLSLYPIKLEWDIDRDASKGITYHYRGTSVIRHSLRNEKCRIIGVNLNDNLVENPCRIIEVFRIIKVSDYGGSTVYPKHTLYTYGYNLGLQ